LEVVFLIFDRSSRKVLGKMTKTQLTKGAGVQAIVVLIVPVICSMAFAACSNLAGTAQNQATTNRVGTYIAQKQEKAGDQPGEADPDPTYEWFY
jgi:hypothetical protein